LILYIFEFIHKFIDVRTSGRRFKTHFRSLYKIAETVERSIRIIISTRSGSFYYGFTWAVSVRLVVTVEKVPVHLVVAVEEVPIHLVVATVEKVSVCLVVATVEKVSVHFVVVAVTVEEVSVGHLDLFLLLYLHGFDRFQYIHITQYGYDIGFEFCDWFAEFNHTQLLGYLDDVILLTSFKQ